MNIKFFFSFFFPVRLLKSPPSLVHFLILFGIELSFTFIFSVSACKGANPASQIQLYKGVQVQDSHDTLSRGTHRPTHLDYCQIRMGKDRKQGKATKTGCILDPWSYLRVKCLFSCIKESKSRKGNRIVFTMILAHHSTHQPL